MRGMPAGVNRVLSIIQKKNQKLTEWLIFLTHSSTLVLNTGIIVGSTLAAPYQSVNYSTK